MAPQPALKGYRTYLAIGLTALTVGLFQMGVIPKGMEDLLVSILTALGIYFRSQA